MKAKLIKTEVNYLLENEEGVIIASTSLKKEGLALSLKNCEAIELGYDLDELANKEYLDGYDTTNLCKLAFKEGFQKALSILGDNKFSEDDMINFAEYCKGDLMKTKDLFNEYQSLQKTEWEVEIVMEEAQEIYRSGVTKYIKVPKLDADGCLILKRK